ncbi:MAG: pyrroline-5-carboxylate reductase [Nitrospirae bacterium]|nr:pyrroline-5-carboxylate reductase [Nitrospirota bacterium]MBF0592230.1 pyrroline-5-carboxylate reductase [Nitrospirota bacterium]
MIGFIGGGNMAEAMLKGMLAKGMGDVLVSEPRQDRRQQLRQLYGINTTDDNVELIHRCDVIILAIKPQSVTDLAQQTRDADLTDKVIISIMAGVNLSYLERVFRLASVVRVMPNTPALEQAGMSVVAVNDDVAEGVLNLAIGLLDCIGKTLVLPEAFMDAVTALSGSGPGFIAWFVDAMIDAGERLGLERDIAAALAIQTLTGTAKLLQCGISPADLIKMVASPGGTTEAGLNVLNNSDAKSIVTQTLTAACQKSVELGKKLGG